jgi:prevent-host-death family protein
MVDGMEKAVSAAEAKRKFSQILHGVRRGHSYVVMSHGKPVAKLSPIDANETIGMSARDTLLSRLRQQPVVKAAHWTRDELYKDAH